MATILFTVGNDFVDLNAYNLDQIEFEGVVVNDAMAGNDNVTLSFTQNLGELFNAGNGRDFVYGSQAGDYIEGGLGKDNLYGQNGDDRLFGGNDVDYLYGGSGADALSGNDDRDFLYGDDGNDNLVGGTGGDYLYGGTGQDELIGADHFDFLYGEDGDDLVSGGLGDDLVSGGAGNDNLYGGRGRDLFLLAGAHLNGSQDRIGDFEVAVDVISLQSVRTTNGTAIAGFADLDTNGDAVLNASDAGVAIVGNALTLSFDGGSLAIARVTQLSASNFDVLIA